MDHTYSALQTRRTECAMHRRDWNIMAIEARTWVSTFGVSLDSLSHANTDVLSAVSLSLQPFKGRHIGRKSVGVEGGVGLVLLTIFTCRVCAYRETPALAAIEVCVIWSVGRRMAEHVTIPCNGCH